MAVLSGKVSNMDGSTMPWVVTILDRKTSEEKIFFTNDHGAFAFNVTPGKHQLALRSYAFSPYTKIISVPPEGKHVKITLRPTLRRLGLS